MSPKGVRVWTLVVSIGWAAPAAAQSIPRHDASGSFGWSRENHAPPDVGYGLWIGDPGISATAGWYWSEHLKSEVTIGGTPERKYYRFQDSRPNPPLAYTVLTERSAVSTVRLSGAQIYQFRHNTFLHPFIGAGLEVTSERSHVETTEETYARPTITSAFQLTSSSVTKTPQETHIRLCAVGLAGLKAYLSQRAFIRGDVSVSAASKVDRFWWRIGGGFDF